MTGNIPQTSEEHISLQVTGLQIGLTLAREYTDEQIVEMGGAATILQPTDAMVESMGIDPYSSEGTQYHVGALKAMNLIFDRIEGVTA